MDSADGSHREPDLDIHNISEQLSRIDVKSSHSESTASVEENRDCAAVESEKAVDDVVMVDNSSELAQVIDERRKSTNTFDNNANSRGEIVDVKAKTNDEKNSDANDNDDGNGRYSSESSKDEYSSGNVKAEYDEDVEEDRLDDDQIVGNPAYVPKSGKYYMHDKRDSCEVIVPVEQDVARSRADGVWQHDRFDAGFQRPIHHRDSREKNYLDYGDGSNRPESCPQTDRVARISRYGATRHRSVFKFPRSRDSQDGSRNNNRSYRKYENPSGSFRQVNRERGGNAGRAFISRRNQTSRVNGRRRDVYHSENNTFGRNEDGNRAHIDNVATTTGRGVGKRYSAQRTVDNGNQASVSTTGGITNFVRQYSTQRVRNFRRNGTVYFDPVQQISLDSAPPAPRPKIRLKIIPPAT